MKTARFLLACAAASLLAACGRDTITAPVGAARSPSPSHDIAPDTGGGSTASGNVGATCIIVVVVNPDGSTSLKCEVDGNSQIGSGS